MNWAMAMLPLAVKVGRRLKRWKTKPILWRRSLVRAASLSAVRSLPSTRTLPRVACASPPIRYRSEDLPHPDGPITATDSPGSTSKFTPRRAGTSTLPARYSFHKFSVLRIGSTLFFPWRIELSAGFAIVAAIAIRAYPCRLFGGPFFGLLGLLGEPWGPAVSA